MNCVLRNFFRKTFFKTFRKHLSKNSLLYLFFSKISLSFIISAWKSSILQQIEQQRKIEVDTKLNLEVNLFLILKTTFKLTQGRMSLSVLAKIELAESDNFS